MCVPGTIIGPEDCEGRRDSSAQSSVGFSQPNRTGTSGGEGKGREKPEGGEPGERGEEVGGGGEERRTEEVALQPGSLAAYEPGSLGAWESVSLRAWETERRPEWLRRGLAR